MNCPVGDGRVTSGSQKSKHVPSTNTIHPPTCWIPIATIPLHPTAFPLLPLAPPRAFERQPQTVPQPNTHLFTAKSTQSPRPSSVGDTLEHEQQPSSSSSTQPAVQVDESLPSDPTYSLPANNPLGATATATNPQSLHGKPSSQCKPRGRSSIIVTRSKSSASTVFPALPYIHRQRRRGRKPARPTPAAKAKRPWYVLRSNDCDSGVLTQVASFRLGASPFDG